MEPIKRGHFEAKSMPKSYETDNYEDGELEITSGDHGVTIAIDDEAAASSENISITASCRLSRANAERLRDWLIEVLL